MSSRTERERLFFALFPSAAVRSAIEKVQHRLRFEARPVVAEQFHMTLAFLGEQPVDRLDELGKLAGAAPLPECSLLLDQVSCFARAGVAFLEASNPPDEIEAFRRNLVDRLDGSGFARDRKPWRPHVTLYRKMRKPCARMDIEPVDWPLRAFSLVSSRLEKTGPVYRVLRRWNSAG